MSLTNIYRRLHRAREQHPYCLVACSGGKDSLATLDIVTRVWPKSHVEAFHLYLVPGLRCELDQVERACRRYKILLHKEPHWMLAQYFKAGKFHPKVRAVGIRNLTQRDVEAQLRKKSNIDWIAYGHRQSDSVSRRCYLRQRGIVDPIHKRITPIHDWTNDMVHAYLRQRRIPIPPVRFGQTKRRSTGFDLTAPVLQWVAEHYPEDIDRILEFFPLADRLLEEKSA